MFDAVIMAGGSGTDSLAQQEGVSNKAFIDLEGRPLLAYILESLIGAPSVRRVVVVGPPEDLAVLQDKGLSFTAIPEGGSMLDSAAAGLAEADPDSLCILSTGDIPLLTPATVENFLETCRPWEADFYYPILTRESCENLFPETRRTYVRLHDGVFTGGNMALIRPSWFRDNRERLEIFIATRKKPLKLLRTLPPSILIKFILGRLTVPDLERTLSKTLHFRAKAVPCDLVELGTDVDKLSDLQVVRQELARRRSRV